MSLCPCVIACAWWSEGHGWTWFSPPTMWSPGIQRRFSGLVGSTRHHPAPEERVSLYLYHMCGSQYCAQVTSSLLPCATLPLRLTQTISPPCSPGGRGGSQANTAQAPPPYQSLMSARAQVGNHTLSLCRQSVADSTNSSVPRSPTQGQGNPFKHGRKVIQTEREVINVCLLCCSPA